jgi:hypothetical protein
VDIGGRGYVGRPRWGGWHTLKEEVSTALPAEPVVTAYARSTMRTQGHLFHLNAVSFLN